MPELYVVDSGQRLGEIDDAELEFLRAQLVDEGPDDRAYFVTAATLEGLREAGCPPRLVGLLELALERFSCGDPYRGGGREGNADEDGVEVGWRLIDRRT